MALEKLEGSTNPVKDNAMFVYVNWICLFVGVQRVNVPTPMWVPNFLIPMYVAGLLASWHDFVANSWKKVEVLIYSMYPMLSWAIQNALESDCLDAKFLSKHTSSGFAAVGILLVVVYIVSVWFRLQLTLGSEHLLANHIGIRKSYTNDMPTAPNGNGTIH